MGGLVRTLFGSTSKSKEKSQGQTASGNYAYPQISDAYGPVMGSTARSSSMIDSLLGLGGGDQTEVLDKFSDSSGMNFIRDQGVKAIEGSAAGRGMLQSGGTGKALMSFGQNVGKTYLQQYLQNLFEQARIGIGAGGLVTGAGGWSKGSSSSSGSSRGAKKGLVQSGLEAFAASKSDPRLKENVEKVGEFDDGLGVYTWNYIGEPEDIRYRGVMADEVLELRPWAYVPNFVGEYAGVDYAKLGKR